MEGRVVIPYSAKAKAQAYKLKAVGIDNQNIEIEVILSCAKTVANAKASGNSDKNLEWSMAFMLIIQ